MLQQKFSTLRSLTLGSTHGELWEEWDALSKDERLLVDRTPWVIAFIAGAFLVCTFVLGGSAVHVSARTEHLVYSPLYGDPPIWILKDALFKREAELMDIDPFAETKPAEPNTEKPPEYHQVLGGDQSSSLINGFIQFSCGDQITVSRVGEGRVQVFVDAVRDVVITDDVDNVIKLDGSLGRKFVFYPYSQLADMKGNTSGTQPEQTFAERTADSSYVWPMEGQIIPGRAVEIDTTTTQGLLLEGRVEFLNRRVLGGGNYLVDSHELELGDHLVLATADAINEKREAIVQGWEDRDGDNQRTTDGERQPWKPELCSDLQPTDEAYVSTFLSSSPADKGFLHVDEEKGMSVSLVSNSHYADIVRYGSTAIRLSSSGIKRLQNDYLFSLGWAVILFMFIMYRRLARAYVIRLSREKQHRFDSHASDDVDSSTDQHQARP